MSGQAPSSRHVSPYLLLALAALFWSGNWVLGRAVHTDIPPVSLNFWRWVTASGVLLPLTVASLVAYRDVIARRWKILVLLSATGVSAFHSAVYYALNFTTAVNALLILATAPVLIVIVTWILFREMITGLQSVGIAVSLAGVVVLVARGSLEVLTTLKFNYGDLWMFVAIPLWAVYSALLKWRPVALPPLDLVASLALVGVLLLLPFYLLEYAVVGPFEITLGNVASILYMGLFASVFAYVFWNRGVAAVGPNKAGLFIHLMPVFGTTLAVIFLSEAVHLYHSAGVALIFLGIYLTTRQGRSRPHLL
ncbi:MAG: DMT family transporter [Candidatus Methylomirabilia bacterium]